MQFQNWIRCGIITGLFLVLFIPFIVSSSLFFPFITGKNFAFRIIIEIVFALWLLLALRDPSVRPKRSLMLYGLLALVASLGVSALLGENPAKAFWSNFERMEGWIGFIHLAAYFVVLTSMFRSTELWKRFWNVSIGVAVALGLYGLMQLAGVFTINQGGVRVDATFGNATYLAVYMLFHFFMTLVAFLTWKPGRLMQIFYCGALALEALMIFYAATRGTILGLVGGLFLAAVSFVLFGKGSANLRKTGVVMLAVLALVVGGFFLTKDTSFVRDNDVLTRIASISLSEGSTRFTIWGMAWEGFKERPIFGWGQEGFNFVFNKYYSPTLYAQEPWFDRAHNEFVDMALAGGVLALILYLTLFLSALYYLWRPGALFELPERTLITGLLAGYAFHNLFVFDNLMSYVMFFSVLAYIASKHTVQSKPLGEESKVGAHAFQVVSGIALILLVATLWFVNAPSLARAGGLIKAVQPHCTNATGAEVPCQFRNGANPDATGQDLGINLAYFKKALTGEGTGRQEAHEQLAQFATQILTPNLAARSTDDFKREVVTFARSEFAKEVARVPDDARLRMFYGALLRQTGDLAGAKAEFEAAHSLSPQKQSIFFELGVLAQDTGDMSAMLEWFRQAYELDRTYDDARVFYAATAIRLDERETANTLLMERFGTVAPPNEHILQSYLFVKDFTRAITVAEELVTASPDNADARLALASVYLNAGRRADAVNALKEAIRLNPDFKAQGEYYIGEIEAGRNP